MFTDKQTGVKIYATLDETLIHATHRPQDLIPAFLEAIRDTVEYAQMLVNNAIPSHALEDDSAQWWDSEECGYFLNEILFDILQRYAPEHFYFGCTEGDGSDYGFWAIRYQDDDFELLPDEVKSILSTDDYDFTYPDCDAVISKLEEIGWTAEFDLSAELYDVRKVAVNE